MTALPVAGPIGVAPAVPAPRTAFPTIAVPAPRTPVEQAGRHRAAEAAETTEATGTAESPDRARPSASRAAVVLTVVGRAGSVVTLAAMLVLAAAVAGLSDGVAPTGDAAAVGTATLR